MAVVAGILAGFGHHWRAIRIFRTIGPDTSKPHAISLICDALGEERPESKTVRLLEELLPNTARIKEADRQAEALQSLIRAALR